MAAAIAAAADDSIVYKLSALLEEVRPSAAALRAASEAADAVAGLVKRIPTQQATHEAVAGFVRDLGLAGEKLAFTFRPPEVVLVAGSHAAGGAVARPDVSADLLVRLPKECFHEKDFLNHRYHAKRCLYLHVIEKSLRSSPLIQKISWSTFLDEARKPVLHYFTVAAKEIAELHGFYVRIIPTASFLFNVSKMNLSTRNNVRAYTKDGINLPTPKYNCSILEDMFLEENVEFISSSVADWKALQEALVLLKVWAPTSKMWTKGLVIQPTKKRTITKEDMVCFLNTFDVVICDVSGHVNLASRMTKSAFIELQDEAACALNCLDKCTSLEKSFRLVDIGPDPENRDEAIKFRKFWGEKAELRRFKDGTIAESTVWESESWEKHTIIKKIADHVLTKHLSLQKEDLIHVVDQLDFCLLVGGQDPVSSSGALFEAFDSLAKKLRLLGDVPLKISTVQPLDPAFRHTSVFPPEPHPLAYEKRSSQRLPNFTATCMRSLEVMIQDQGMFVTASEDEVNVLTSGYSFLLKIFHERDVDGKAQNVPSEDKELFLRSQHSSMINGLHGRYQVYGPVVRLAKRWISAHLFSSFISEEAVELLVAYLFLKPYPFNVPSSRVAGFLSFDWTFSPMIIDINNDFNLKDEKEINENFMLSRKSYEQNPHDIEPAMFLATSYDKASEAWTRHSPSKLVLKRMASYAKSSAELLTNLIIQGQSGQYTWECVFRTPLSNYDAVVLLHQEKLCRPHQVLFPAETPNGKLVICGKPCKDFHPYMPLNKGVVKSLHDSREKILVNFDPTTYFLRDLKSAFPKTFKLWYDSIGGDAIGLTWENSKKRGRDEADETMLDPASILKEVGNVGKGLVRGVYLLKAPKL
uniref:Nucleolar protein 6 n=1 Tax=Oryza meridionalis TaxID=40149 RepID=A0A0E0F9V8_9ORYZ